MGSWHDAGTVQAMIDATPEGAILCLDEAYIDFAPDQTAPPIDVSNPRVIRFRTFSKAYGMAGARVGYGVAAADLALAFNKVRNHFGVNRIAQAGALASLADTAWLDQVRGWVEDAKRRIAAIGRAHGFEALPSATNFVALDLGRDGDYSRSVLAELGKAGVFVRMPFTPPGDRCIRISAGKQADLDAFEEAFPAALKAAG